MNQLVKLIPLILLMTLNVQARQIDNRFIKDKTITASKVNSQTATNGYVLTADGSGNATFAASSGTANVQSTASGTIGLDSARFNTTGSSTNCTMTSSNGSWVTCTRNGTGDFTFTFSPAYSARPDCWFQGDRPATDAYDRRITINTTGWTSSSMNIRVKEYNNTTDSDPPSNANTGIFCMGPR